jgi:hypothetical protein
MIGKIALIAAAAIVAVSASAAPRPGYNAYGSVAPLDTQSNARTVGRNVAAARTTALRDCNASSDAFPSTPGASSKAICITSAWISMAKLSEPSPEKRP